MAQETYKNKIMGAEEAAKLVKSGDRVYDRQQFCI